MTLEELKVLTKGEVVVFTKVDEKIKEYHNHQVGDTGEELVTREQLLKEKNGKINKII